MLQVVIIPLQLSFLEFISISSVSGVNTPSPESDVMSSSIGSDIVSECDRSNEGLIITRTYNRDWRRELKRKRERRQFRKSEGSQGVNENLSGEGKVGRKETTKEK